MHIKRIGQWVLGIVGVIIVFGIFLGFVLGLWSLYHLIAWGIPIPTHQMVWSGTSLLVGVIILYLLFASAADDMQSFRDAHI